MMTNGKTTIAIALHEAVNYLKKNNTIETPRLDAEVLLCYILNCERIYLTINKDSTLSEENLLKFKSYLERRFNNEPVSYITNKREFMSLEFQVCEGVLIPRPDTEILTEEIIKLYKGKNVNILDLCTGSGAIAVSLAHYISDAKVTAVDKYDICVNIARKNAENNRVKERVNVIRADVFNNISFDMMFDCVVSNPPYINSDVLSTLSDDVKKFEPSYALDGGSDGLIFYNRITQIAVDILKSGGILAYEIGYDQGEKVCKILQSTNSFINIKIIKDLSGLDRVILAEKR